MRFERVGLVAIGGELPDEVWSSESIERRLQPLYHRLRLPEGRLELMTGIRERRVWPAGTLPSGPSVRTGRLALEASGVDPARVGCLIHASVCRDFLEPATASRVHHELGLPAACWVYDLSNACLGLLNGAVQVAMMIESGAIGAGLVVGTESSRPLLEETIAALNRDETLTRKSVKSAVASLTIGSGSCAWLLADRRLCPDATPLHVATALARTEFHDLCRSDQDAGAGMQPLMDTDSERLMAEGIETGRQAFEGLLAETGWRRADIDRTACHQVGSRHRQAMLGRLGLPPEGDSLTFDRLGNTGSVALPLTLAAAASRDEVCPGHRLALLGIGSGINSVMAAATWQTTAVAGDLSPLNEPAFAQPSGPAA